MDASKVRLDTHKLNGMQWLSCPEDGWMFCLDVDNPEINMDGWYSPDELRQIANYVEEMKQRYVGMKKTSHEHK